MPVDSPSVPRPLSLLESGAGLPLVFLHAFPLSREMWGVQIPLLREHFRILAPDLRGFGASPIGDDFVPGTPVTVADHAADILAMMKKHRAYPAVLAGLSLGGYILLEILRQDPKAALAVVLADTQAGADTDVQRASREEFARKIEQEGMASVTDTLLNRLLGPSTLQRRPTLVSRVRDLMLHAPVAGVAATSRGMGLRPDSMADLEKISVPTLLMVGEHDAITPPAATEAMAAKIPDATALRIAGAGHLSNLENPLAFNESIRLFLMERLG